MSTPVAQPVCRRPGGPHARREEGQVSLLILGLTVIALMLILGAVDVTAAQLARTRLLDAADSAALDAADAITADAAYGSGFEDAVRISDATVRQAAGQYLAVQPRPGGILSWGLDPGTGSPDGRTSVVRLSGTVELPMSGLLLDAFGGSVTISVESRARSNLD